MLKSPGGAHLNWTQLKSFHFSAPLCIYLIQLSNTHAYRAHVCVCVFRLTLEPQLCSWLWIFPAWQNIGYVLYASRDTTLARLPYYYLNLLHRPREQVSQISLVSTLTLPQLWGIPGRLGHVFIKRSRAVRQPTRDSWTQSNWNASKLFLLRGQRYVP